MDKLITSFITVDSEEFQQAIEIRYDELYKANNLPKSIAVDDLDDTSLHCITKSNGQVIGYGRLTIDGDKGRISKMAIKKEWQKKGVGKKIVLAMIEKAQKLSIKHLYMEARVHAVSFYEKFGFYTVGEVFPSKITSIPHQKMVMDL